MNQNGNPMDLPDLFTFQDGSPVETKQDWARRRQELMKLLLDIEYGQLPPVPRETLGEHLHTHKEARFHDANFSQYRVVTNDQRPFTFRLDLYVPKGDGPFPVIINGDACWRLATDDIINEILRRNIIFAYFSRVELAPDIYNSDRSTGLYLSYPDGDFGAIAAWAWGYHRCVDVLQTLDCVIPEQIAIAGHSRGGKTVLLAGATDERIAVTGVNNSGACGAGCFRHQGPGSETLEDSIRMIPYWFGPKLKDYVGREADLPFDQHSLKALVAPRALLTTEALGDLWANPSGTWLTHQAARKAYRFLDADDNIAIWFREGGHNHGWDDWNVFLDFCDWKFRGIPIKHAFNQNPFPELP